jgi:hypothetical protein
VSRAGRPCKSKSEEKSEVASGFAPNLAVLAELLGIDRRTLTNARQRFASDTPKQRADGRYPVAEYAKWLDRHAVNGRRTDPELGDERGIKLDLLKLNLERQRFEFERIRDRMLPSAQFELALAKMLAAFLAALNAFPARLNESLEGLDFNDRARVLESEVTLLRKTLATCDYLNVEEPDVDDE